MQVKAPHLLSESVLTSSVKLSAEKCGLGLANSIIMNLDNFTPTQQAVLKNLLQRPSLHTSIVSESGKFRIHYDTLGNNMPKYNPELSVTENVLEVSKAIDSAYTFEVDFLEYPSPPNDFGEGGDELYDIYIYSLGDRLYGGTTPEDIINDEYQTSTSYIEIHSEFGTGFNTHGFNAMQVTIAHELHHAIQIGNYVNRYNIDGYYYELTSTSMEEFVYDHVNDYHFYIDDYFNNPSRPFVRNNLRVGDGYDIAIWNIFLEKTFDFELIKRQWELMPSVRAIIAINISLFEYGSSFAKEFNRFAIWMYFTNYRAVPGSYFEEAVNYPLVEQTSVLQFTPPLQTLDMSSKAAAHSFVTFVIPGNNDSLVTIVSNGDVQSAVNGSNNFFDFQYTLFADSSSGERFLTENYSSTFSADNPAFWSVSEILNHVVVREDDAATTPVKNIFEFAYPSPFEYQKSYLLGSFLFIPFSAILGETVDFNIYSSSMALVFRSKETIKFLPGEQVGIIWNALDDSGEKLASGVYIYVIKKGDDVTKGKIVLFN